jgi:hypothetical protein
MPQRLFKNDFINFLWSQKVAGGHRPQRSAIWGNKILFLNSFSGNIKNSQLYLSIKTSQNIEISIFKFQYKNDANVYNLKLTTYNLQLITYHLSLTTYNPTHLLI